MNERVTSLPPLSAADLALLKAGNVKALEDAVEIK